MKKEYEITKKSDRRLKCVFEFLCLRAPVNINNG